MFKAKKSKNFKPNDPYKEIRCYKCQKLGHMANKCRVKMNTAHYAVKVVNEDEESEQGDDHETAFMANLSKLLQVIGYIYDHELRLGIYTGCTSSVMNLSTAKKCGFKINKSSLQVKLANSQIMDIEGRTDLLPLTIQGYVTNLEFLIMDHDDHDILLGLDWFELTGAGMYPSKKELRFPSDKISLATNFQFRVDDEDENVCLVEIGDDVEVPEEIEWDINKKFVTNPAGNLSEKELKTFNTIIEFYKDVMVVDIKDLDACTVRCHEIETTTKQTIFIPPYRLSLKEREMLKEKIKEMEEAGIIRKSKSPWSAPVILIPKKDGDIRPCIDYRRLNAITVTQPWPIPRIQDILADLGGSEIFSSLDLNFLP